MATTATRQDSRFYTHTLSNGLQMLGQYIPGVQSAASVFYVQTGTRDEEKSQMGVSHFLEHMAFKRTVSFTGAEIDQGFEEMGADYNAGTWKEMTFYWARVLRENVPRAIEILAELTHPRLEEQDFVAERKVILEEIARYQDMPHWVASDHLLSDYFRQHPLAWDTLGTPDTIGALTIDEMRSYWLRRYGAANILFSIAGNFDWDEVRGELERLSDGWETGESGRRLDAFSFEPSFGVYQHEKFVQEQIGIAVPSVASRDPEYFPAAVLSTILGDETGSRLYWALYQEGLADSATAQVMDFDDTGALVVYVGTEPSKAQRALDVTQSELERIQRFDVTEDELERAKAKITSSVIIGGESTNERVMALINSWLTQGRLETLEEIRGKIEAVTLDSLRRYLDKHPVFPRQVIAAVGPLLEDGLANPAG